jgi:hypothetical protein
LYWGDSWFSTPLYLNLAKQSMLRIDGMAMVVGKPGATAAELFTTRRIRQMTDWLRTYPFDALCLSAGGNDELSERLESMFAPWMKARPPAKLTPQAAFARVLESGTLDKVQARYAAVLDGMAPVLKKQKAFRVVGHTYAPLQRIGAAADLTVGNIGLIAWIKDDVGPWLWPTMKRVLANTSEGKVFADLLLQDGFRDRVLKPLSAPSRYGKLFSCADFSQVPETTDPSFWNDEIHPTEKSFAVLARTYNKALRDQLPTAKQAAVT